MNTSTNKELPPPEQEIRSDLWPTMSITQLNHQRDLVLDKISKMRSMMYVGTASPSIQMLHDALQVALKELTALVDNRSSSIKR